MDNRISHQHLKHKMLTISKRIGIIGMVIRVYLQIVKNLQQRSVYPGKIYTWGRIQQQRRQPKYVTKLP